MRNNRPRIKVQLDPNDIFLELLGIIAILTLIMIPILYYAELPDSIPRHYGAQGEPNGFGSKSILLALPIFSVVLYLGLATLNWFPHIFNYPTKVTEENAGKMYKSGTKMIRNLNVIIAVMFAYISYSTVQTALGSQNGLGGWFLPVSIGLIVVVEVFGIIRMYKQ